MNKQTTCYVHIYTHVYTPIYIYMYTYIYSDDDDLFLVHIAYRFSFLHHFLLSFHEVSFPSETYSSSSSCHFRIFSYLYIVLFCHSFSLIPLSFSLSLSLYFLSSPFKKNRANTNHLTLS